MSRHKGTNPAGRRRAKQPDRGGKVVNDDQTDSITRWADEPIPAELLTQYGCGPIKFTGSGDALYERHLMFDDVVDPTEVGPRERYEAIARSVRDVLSQRWHRTEHSYDRENPKRVYY